MSEPITNTTIDKFLSLKKSRPTTHYEQPTLVFKTTNKLLNKLVLWYLQRNLRAIETEERKYKLRFRMRYRKPKKGINYGFGGSLRKANARKSQLYIDILY